jgi:Mn-dependent DtxR family transcriptional regulator
MLSSDTIPFTQDMIAEMLAVRRTSISEAAAQLYGAEFIDYKRGTIRILDRASLSKLARRSE